MQKERLEKEANDERVRNAVYQAILAGHHRALEIRVYVAGQTASTYEGVYRSVDRALRALKKRGIVVYHAKDGWKKI